MDIIFFKGITHLINAFLKRQSFLTFRLYSKYAFSSIKNIDTIKIYNLSKFAIVMQGPLVREANFTVETLKLYRIYFPNAILIFSTWELDENIIEICSQINVVTKINSLPENAGISNVNLQIISSRSGILLAKELGANYVMKTRSDQRVYHRSIDSYFYNLINTFPINVNSPLQKSRIIGVSMNTIKLRLYGLSDFLLYGHIDDLLLFFSLPLDCRHNSNDKSTKAANTFREYSLLRICEVYLTTEYLKSLGRNLTYTLEDSFRMFKEHFLIVDHTSIYLYWHKYNAKIDKYDNDSGYFPEISFNDWLILYNSNDLKMIDENIIDSSISDLGQFPS